MTVGPGLAGYIDAVAKRKIIVHIATSADGYIARSDGNLDWLTDRPAPKGFYGLPEFMRTVDAKILGRKTFELSVRMGAAFSARDVHYVFSRQPPPASVPAGVHFVTQPIRAFAKQMRAQAGKTMWMMGGGELIASFLDEGAIDELIISVVPTFIGEGIRLIAPRHLQVPLRLLSVQPFPDGVVQLHYRVRHAAPGAE
jgi:dihydrofolate reductase